MGEASLPKLIQVADKVVSAMPRLNVTGQRVAIEVFRLLAERMPVPPLGSSTAAS